MSKIFLTAILLLATADCVWSQALAGKGESILLDGNTAQMVISKSGGAIVDFHLKEQGLNPLTWVEKTDVAGIHRQGHFLCLDRWGAPSAAEERNGMPFHGEAALVVWQVTRQPEKRDGAIIAEMTSVLPLAGLEVKRQIRMSESNAFVSVREAVTNTKKLGRIYNMVQHPTIAPPFLDENTIVDANARRGLMTDSPLPNLEEPSVYWPQALKDGQPVNLRFLTNDPAPNVVSYTLDDDYGWYTACNPAKGLLIGYIWRATEYPWLIAWRDVQDGRPSARGLEFGTNGVPHPDGVLVAKGKIFGRQTFQHLDAGQTVEKSYAVFLLKIPKNYRGVAAIDYSNGRLTLHERGLIEPTSGPDRDLVISSGELFAN